MGYNAIKWVLFGAVAGLALLMAALFLNRPYTFHATPYNPPFQAPDFRLADQSGRSFHLADEQGKVVLLYFGFTHCPDECPGTMAIFEQVANRLGSQAKNVDFVFITLDPANDTPAQLQAFLAPFGSDIRALTGSPAELGPVWKAYGAYLEADTPAASSSGDHIPHSDQIYVIDRQGMVRLTYPFGISPEDILADVRYLLHD